MSSSSAAADKKRKRTVEEDEEEVDTTTTVGVKDIGKVKKDADGNPYWQVISPEYKGCRVNRERVRDWVGEGIHTLCVYVC